jgi:sulfite reductase (NADPH) hemoprotein beta-component
MHALQTSGNCVRNVTTDPFAGVAADEIEDPRIWAEVLRQWSSVHPEFSFLPRKFKIAITGALEDRAAVAFHDIGIRIVKGTGEHRGKTGFRILAGGGQGRTPYLGQTVREFLPKEHLLSYIEAIMRVYNLAGRRDNIYKARIKILINAVGIEAFRRRVEEEWQGLDRAAIDLPADELARIAGRFETGAGAPAPAVVPAVEARRRTDAAFDRWLKANVRPHRTPGHAIVTIALKRPGAVPGDATSEEMEAVAALAERHSGSEIRVTYTQNLVLPTVTRSALPDLYDGLLAAGLADGSAGLIGDIIACPGLDYCNLANARSIPIAKAIGRRFADPARAAAIGPLRLNISGCINACGHHHAGHIGILGVDKKGTEHYQITIGGDSGDAASIGTILGPSFRADDIPAAVETIVDTYMDLRRDAGETFLDAVRRLGSEPFRQALYGSSNAPRRRELAEA